ncbi:MAG: PAS domain S-box protein, partial [Archaeoglobaceae archaeon]
MGVEELTSLLQNEETLNKLKILLESVKERENDKKLEERVAELEKKLVEKEKELEIKNREAERLRKFVETIFWSVPKPICIYFLDKNGKLRYFNEYVLKLFNKKKEDVIGFAPSEIFYAPDGKRRLADVGLKTNIEIALEKGGLTVEGIEAALNTEIGKIPILTSCGPVRIDGELEGMVGFFVDISSIKEKEEEIKKAYELVNNIFKNLPTYVIFVDENGKIKFANDNAAKLAGYSRAEEIIGLKPTDIAKIHSEYSENAKIIVEAVKNRQKVENVEVKLVSKIGEIFTNVSIYPIYIGNDFAGYIEVFTDVTVYKEKESELKQILDGIPVATFVIDANHTVVHWDQSMEEITGVKAEEVVGTKDAWKGFYREKRPTLADIVADHPKDADRFDSKILKSEMVKGAYYVDIHEANYPRASKKRWVRTTATPIFDSKGNLVKVVETIEDFTEVKMREKQLERILNSLPVAVLLMDASKTVKFWNKACEDLTGVKAEEVVGTKDAWKAFYKEKRPTFGEIIIDNPKDAERYYDKVYRSSIVDGAFVVEARFELPRNRRLVHFRTTGTPILDENGKVESVVVAMEDIKELKDREMEIQQNLKYISECLSKLSYGIRELEAGNLNVKLQKIKDDEFGKTFEEFNEFV